MCRYLKYLSVLIALCASFSLPSAALAEDELSITGAVDPNWDSVENVPYCESLSTDSTQDCVTKDRDLVEKFRSPYTGGRNCTSSPGALCAAYKRTRFDRAGDSVTELLDLDAGNLVVTTGVALRVMNYLSISTERMGLDFGDGDPRNLPAGDLAGGLVRTVANVWPILQQNREQVVSSYEWQFSNSLGVQEARALGERVAQGEAATTIRAIALHFGDPSERHALWSTYLRFTCSEEGSALDCGETREAAVS